MNSRVVVHVVGNSAKSAIKIVLTGFRDEATAYRIARLSGYSPQHINRVLKQMYFDGLVGYRLEKHRNGEKRVWCLSGKNWGKDEWNFYAYQHGLQL
jgi:transcription initiation factor IIE alpha subunit